MRYLDNKHFRLASMISTMRSGCWLFLLLLGQSSLAADFGDQWYVGAGGGVSLLRADPSAANSQVERADDAGSSATVFFGRDFEHQSSLQFQVYSFGDAVFNNGETARYSAADATVIYRFFDTRDKNPDAFLPLSLYGRLGLGYIERQSSVSLSHDDPVFFGAGAGVESYFTHHLGMRLEAFYHEVDTASVSLALVTRFGGADADPDPDLNSPAPDGTEGTITTDSSPSGTDTDTVETVAAGNATDDTADTATLPSDPVVLLPLDVQNPVDQDDDGDGISNGIDLCPDSLPGYPVDEGGCSPLGNIAERMTFPDQSTILSSSAIGALNQLAALLKQYPDMRVELVAHTDNRGTPEGQSALTRQRLRNLGIYLLRQGIDKNRLLLRSFAGKRPAFDNATLEGRRRNNRIEVLENPL